MNSCHSCEETTWIVGYASSGLSQWCNPGVSTKHKRFLCCTFSCLSLSHHGFNAIQNPFEAEFKPHNSNYSVFLRPLTWKWPRHSKGSKKIKSHFKFIFCRPSRAIIFGSQAAPHHRQNMDNVFSAFYVLRLHIYHKKVTVMSSLGKQKKGSLAASDSCWKGKWHFSHCVTLLQLKPSAIFLELTGIFPQHLQSYSSRSRVEILGLGLGFKL